MMRSASERTGFIQTASIQGVEAHPVTVEVSLGTGLPGISIVGMPDTAVQEARLRVRLALIAAGFEVPYQHIVVNLAPSSLKKVGSGFDLPIALGILVATGQIPKDLIGDRVCVGELSLDGSLRSTKGLLAYEKHAHETKRGLLTALVERGVYRVEQQEHLCLKNLAGLHTASFENPYERGTQRFESATDFCEIDGNDVAKRALQIAAAASHGILLMGPPGSGKSMMAARLPSILPPLNEEERLESSMIHSIAGLPFDDILAGRRPFRSPHHSATRAGLMGGGTPPSPGEVSLAHNGVLFLDEMPEFGGSVLQMLRQPIESGTVSLARARGTLVFPARFLLVGAANPCPCGFFGDAHRSCRCTPAQVMNYQGRIGGPLMDRFDLIVNVWRCDPSEVLRTGQGISSATLRKGVFEARSFRAQRSLEGVPQTVASAASVEAVLSCSDESVATNELMGKGAQLIASCALGKKELGYLEEIARHYQLSGRGIMRSLAVARTIADIEQKDAVNSDHLLEAVSFRADVEEKQ